MKVTLLTYKDFAGSGTRIVEGLRKLGVDAEIISFYPSRYGQGVQEKFNAIEAEKRIFESDILHWKGDDTPSSTFFETFKIPNKPIVFMAGGSRFRRGDFSSRPIAPLEDYKAGFSGAETPELCYNDVRWTPHSWGDFEYTFKKRDKFNILHIPSNKYVKGTEIINQAIEILRSTRNDFDYKTYTNIPNKKCLELKKNANIYIDQCILPHYALAGVEAMAFGVPIFANVRDYPINTPVINLNGKEVTAENIAIALNDAMEWGKLEKLSIETYNYCKSIHGKGAEMWKAIYQDVLEKTKIYFLIPTFGQSKYIVECIKSFKDEDCKIIVGIDGCKETAKILQHFSQNNVEVKEYEENRGCYSVLNDLLKFVPYGSNFVFFGSDDVWIKGGVEILKQYTEEDAIQFSYQNFGMQKGIDQSSSSRMYSRRIVDSYENYRCGADTALMKELSGKKQIIKDINQVLFNRRVHSESLTKCKEYGFESEYRKAVKNKINSRTPYVGKF